MSKSTSTSPGRHARNSGSKLLNDYQLGDSLGKGAFGQVYRALNWATGETVAVKEIQLSNIPKGELGQIMSEIDLLKNLNHPNIVKYKGFVKTKEYLYIILEFCENGSLNTICKRFGKFPENLVAVYICQVLEGLVYLHDQGVIHRDIKGANLLTNKDGCVKLADFGVASTAAAGTSDDAVVGSPYWMAPEVIEQSGATTASDVWSVGCVVIELLEGRPPYHFLDPMPALFRIVQDDCPPIPDGASPIVKDFLLHCFQKDSNLRISAKKLLRHPWMISARKQMDVASINESGPPANGQRGSNGNKERPRSNYNYDEAVLKVQEWNEALKSPHRPIKQASRSSVHEAPPSPTPPSRDKPAISLMQNSALGLHPTGVAAPALLKAGPPANTKASVPLGLVEKIREPLAFTLQPPEDETDNWDDDFEDGISFTKLAALEKNSSSESEDDKQDPEDNNQTIRAQRSPVGGATIPLAKAPASEIPPIVEDYSDLASEEDEMLLQEKVADFKLKNSVRKGLFHPNDIRVLGITQSLSSFSSPSHSPGPLSAPLPNVENSPPSFLRALSKRPSRPSLGPTRSHSHSRSSSFVGSFSSSSGSFTRAEARRIASQTEIDKYAEDDVEDYDDVFGKPSVGSTEPTQTLQLNTRYSNKSWRGDEDDDDDPFAEIDEGFAEDDLETNLLRDKHARLTSMVNELIDELTPSAAEFQLREACEQLISILIEAPEMQAQLVSAHGMLAILEVMEGKPSRDVLMKLLQIINILVTSDVGFLESFCLIGGIPVMMGFTSKRYSSECRQEASNFVRLLCHTSVLTLQMFISNRGLKVLVDLLDEDYTEQSELVEHALHGICSVFELQSPTTKNDFCRMFIREGLLDPLSAALLNVMGNKSPEALEMKHRIIQILLVFSQVTMSDIHVRNAMGTRKIIRRLLRACELLEPECVVQMLKAVKHLSMNATLLEVIQNANAIEILVRLLDEQRFGPHSAEMSNHIFQTCYNLCRLNKLRQEEAAQAGIIPCLQRVSETTSPLKQFALPILCDLASAGKSCRKLLWQNNGLSMYLGLLSDPYFQVSALEAILSWLQDETAKIEDELIKPDSLDALVTCFVNAKANSFENLLDPFLKIMRLSTGVTVGLARAPFFRRIVERLGPSSGGGASRAVVRLNLLRILRTACDVHPNRLMLVERYGLDSLVRRLSADDGAVLVRELAREILPGLEPALRPSGSHRVSGALKPAEGRTGSGFVAPKKTRRTASEASASVSSVFSPPGSERGDKRSSHLLHMERSLSGPASRSASGSASRPVFSAPSRSRLASPPSSDSGGERRPSATERSFSTSSRSRLSDLSWGSQGGRR
ncbi:hypothetical protein CONPUDRAFT_104294 [Coniophora puteana RWD-64-598 SS2]|uniref:non-specific serine/threonine protein kinase n=1 Tax=Coniophora puteana (strain RWD-64-598) TaxID=741705 RepID=A0A5M3MPX0_CONPW|nr:uncharacterized protein CONPUDRAFT_104294 [Coniophora puteana RWD-64-598 SS2]EIW81107.1 hypothetical protein CONPUDRAFT_104294 [Coniophora puteana RWD-64-598 SS2]